MRRSGNLLYQTHPAKIVGECVIRGLLALAGATKRVKWILGTALDMPEEKRS